MLFVLSFIDSCDLFFITKDAMFFFANSYLVKKFFLAPVLSTCHMATGYSAGENDFVGTDDTQEFGRISSRSVKLVCLVCNPFAFFLLYPVPVEKSGE